MVPPQVRPISQASSSPRFSSRSRGAFRPRTSADSSMTCASTQPPIVTDPRMRPPSPTTILAPSFLGVVPRVFTRVATATLDSSCFNLSMCSKSSLMAFSMPASSQCQMARQITQAGEVVGRGEMIDQRQRRRHPARERLVRWIAEQRVEPDHPASQSLQRQHLVRQDLGLARVPAVRQQEDDRVTVHEVPPAPIEFLQALADSRAPREVPDIREPSKRRPVRGPLQKLGDPGQTRGEREGLDPAEDVLECVKELEKEACVKVHRTGHITQEHEPHLLAPAL